MVKKATLDQIIIRSRCSIVFTFDNRSFVCTSPCFRSTLCSFRVSRIESPSSAKAPTAALADDTFDPIVLALRRRDAVIARAFVTGSTLLLIILQHDS